MSKLQKSSISNASKEGESSGLQVAKVESENSLVPVQSPYFSAGSIVILATGNDFILVFKRPVPVQPGSDDSHLKVMLNEPVATIAVSPQTAKDIVTSLENAVSGYEKEYGEIVTPYTREQGTSGRRAKGS